MQIHKKYGSYVYLLLKIGPLFQYSGISTPAESPLCESLIFWWVDIEALSLLRFLEDLTISGGWPGLAARF